MSTEQESFWKGAFGDEYTDRNRGAHRIASDTALFARALGKTQPVGSALELGSNIGLNLAALKALLPDARLSAVEVNRKAAAELKTHLPEVDLHVGSATDFQSDRQWDLVFTKGVLIHINPDKLTDLYQVLYTHSARYILVVEYYNPVPVEIVYRGESGKLFKRDFAGELLDAFADLRLVDYGFVYHRDANFPQDDLSWFLLEKT